MECESISDLNYKTANAPKGSSGPHSRLIHHDIMVCKGWICPIFILVHKGVLINTQGLTRHNKLDLLNELID